MTFSRSHHTTKHVKTHVFVNNRPLCGGGHLARLCDWQTDLTDEPTCQRCQEILKRRKKMAEIRIEVQLRATKGHDRRFEIAVYKSMKAVEEDSADETWEVISHANIRVVGFTFFRLKFNRPAEHSCFFIGGYFWVEAGECSVCVRQINNFNRFPVRRGLLLPERAESLLTVNQKEQI